MEPVAPDPRDDVEALQPAVRAFAARKLRTLVERLEPEIDGSSGPVNPRMIEVYLKALRDFGDLYRVRDRPPPRPEPEDTAAIAQQRLEVLQAKVAAQLRELQGRTGS